METKINYALIGLFILFLGAAAIIIPLWLASGLDRQHYQTYLIYMNEAVDGLAPDAPVKFNGVNVGRVRNIKLNLANPQQVEILLDIKEHIPITTHTVAELRDRGVTGVEYIGLKGGNPNGAQPLIAKPGQRYPVIAVSPSILVKLDGKFTELMNDASKLSAQLDQVFTPKNITLLHQTLMNLGKVTGTLAANSQQITHTVQSMKTLTQNLSQSSQPVPDILNQLQLTSRNLHELSAELRQNPSLLLRGRPSPPLGPGEK